MSFTNFDDVEIVMTAYKRPEYLAQALASWKNVRGIEDVPFTLFLEPSPKAPEMLDVIKHSGLDMEVVRNTHLQGVLTNPWKALDYAFAEPTCGFAILAEEDLVVSPDVLEYFAKARRQFEAQEPLGICCYSGAPEGTPDEITLHQSFDVWIWGTWKHCWEHYIRDTWDFDYSTNNGILGVAAGWDWNLTRISKRLNKPFVKTSNSRSKHIGKENGTHMTPHLFEEICNCPTFSFDR